MKRELEKLKDREEQLIDACVHRRVINDAPFRLQHDKLKEEMTLVEMQLNEVRLEEHDLEAVLNFSLGGFKFQVQRVNTDDAAA